MWHRRGIDSYLMVDTIGIYMKHQMLITTICCYATLKEVRVGVLYFKQSP